MAHPSEDSTDDVPALATVDRRRFLALGMLTTSAVLLGINAYLFDRNRRIRAVINAKDDAFAKSAEKLLAARNFPRSSPETLSSDPELLAFVNEHFEVIAGNASIEEADVIGIGEAHATLRAGYDYDQEAKKNAMHASGEASALLAKITNAGDRVLLEAIQWGEDVTHMGMMLPLEYPWMIRIREKGLKFSGWDDLKTKNDASIGMIEGSLLRNERGLIPAVLESAPEPGKTFVVAGLGHFADDSRIDETLEKAGVRFLILGHKLPMEQMRRGTEKIRNMHETRETQR